MVPGARAADGSRQCRLKSASWAVGVVVVAEQMWPAYISVSGRPLYMHVICRRAELERSSAARVYS